MTRQQLEWAKRHDWYRSVLNVGTYDAPQYRVFVACQVVKANKSVEWDRRNFVDYRSLRAWAGY